MKPYNRGDTKVCPRYCQAWRKIWGYLGFAWGVRVSAASFCDLSKILIAQEKLQHAQLYRVRNMHCVFPLVVSARTRIPPNFSPWLTKHLRGVTLIFPLYIYGSYLFFHLLCLFLLLFLNISSLLHSN